MCLRWAPCRAQLQPMASVIPFTPRWLTYHILNNVVFCVRNVYQVEAKVLNHHPLHTQHGQHPQAAMRKYQCKMCPQVTNPERTFNWLRLTEIIRYFFGYIQRTSYSFAIFFFSFPFFVAVNFVPFVSARNANMWVKNVATTPPAVAPNVSASRFMRK